MIVSPIINQWHVYQSSNYAHWSRSGRLKRFLQGIDWCFHLSVFASNRIVYPFFGPSASSSTTDRQKLSGYKWGVDNDRWSISIDVQYHKLIPPRWWRQHLAYYGQQIGQIKKLQLGSIDLFPTMISILFVQSIYSLLVLFERSSLKYDLWVMAVHRDWLPLKNVTAQHLRRLRLHHGEYKSAVIFMGY